MWTDGSAPWGPHQPDDDRAFTGAGIVAVSINVHREWSLPLGLGTNNTAELGAVREALLRVKDRPKSWVQVFTDSEYVAGVLKPDCEWFLSKNVDLVVQIRRLCEECGRFEIMHVPGHKGIPNNERADKLADAARKAAKSEDARQHLYFGSAELEAAWKDYFREVLRNHGVFDQKPESRPKPKARARTKRVPLVKRPRVSTAPDPALFVEALEEWDDWSDPEG